MEPRPAPSILIAIPKLLPAESRYTASAAAWVDAQVCVSVLSRLKTDLPRTQVQVGIAAVSEVVIKILWEDNPRVRREMEGKTRKATECALQQIQELLE